MILLNKIPCLDKGFVSLLSTSNNGAQLKEIFDTYYGGKIKIDVLKHTNISMIVKCPFFVLDNIKTYLNCTSLPSNDIEFLIPDISMISASTTEDKMEVKRYIESTTETLKVNLESFKTDGLEACLAESMIPIGVYVTAVVSGTLIDYMRYIDMKKDNQFIAAYKQVVSEAVSAEFSNLNILIDEYNNNIIVDKRRQYATSKEASSIVKKM